MNSKIHQRHAIAQRKANTVSAYLCELIATTLVIFNSLGWACWNFGDGSLIVELISDRQTRVIWQAICVASGAAIVVYSPLGKRAGGHLNPAMTLGFWLLNKISTPDAFIYITMQFLGAFIGTFLVVVMFPDLAHSIHAGVTVVAQGISPAIAFGLEASMMFVLMLVVLVTVNSAWMRFTGIIAPAMFALMYVQAVRLTGASLNPARSLAPATLAMIWQHQWIYWTAPPLGALLAAFLYRQGVIGTHKSYCCKLYHTSDVICHHARCGYCNPTYIDDFTKSK